MKGAITICTYNSSETGVSIRTPMKGAIETCEPVELYFVSFNPHAHEGRDEEFYVVNPSTGYVSIRTPMKGAIGHPVRMTP